MSKSIPCFNCRSHSRFSKRGLSFLEIVGAIAAVSAGMWLGASYLGLDMREVWNKAADKAGFEQYAIVLPTDEETELGEEVDRSESCELEPSELSNTVPSETKAPEETTPKAGDKEAKMQAEITKLHQAIEALSKQKNGAQINASSDTSATSQATHSKNQPTKRNETKKQRIGRRSLAYWNKLNAIMQREEEIRTAPVGGLTAGNASAFLENRGKASKFAYQTIRKLPTSDVDRRVVSIGNAIADWFEKGDELNDKAMYLLNDAAPSARKGPAGQEWKAAERQHSQNVELINRRGDALRGQLSGKYGLAFPDLR